VSRKPFEQQLAALEELRGHACEAGAVEGLRKALTNRNNYIVAKASNIAGENGLKALVPDMVGALDRFFLDPAKSDPQCWAKNALIQALACMGHDEAPVYIRGLRHVQMEAVWGGQEDTACALRAHCALALVECRDLPDMELLSYLLEPLADPDKNVRIQAARAIGRVGRPEAALLLRLRALTGDDEPEMLGACFSSLLSIEGRAGVTFVSRFLDAREDTAGEAAVALALMRDADALAALCKRWKMERRPAVAEVLLSAIVLSRLPEGVAFLTDLIGSDSDARAQVLAAVGRSGSQELQREFEKRFPID
jgi:HEAT repeat protein